VAIFQTSVAQYCTKNHNNLIFSSLLNIIQTSRKVHSSIPSRSTEKVEVVLLFFKIWKMIMNFYLCGLYVWSM